ncbi:MAG: ribosomal protein S18-alanine N-acetyltransferase [Thermodesulfobacteriota bacterium]|nr:ribosomal protein S18-alanine N-acetyltransferase [Thermodesulfobacteriota bacterium]
MSALSKLDRGHVTVREMTSDDLDEVLSIEETSFPTPWTKAMFQEELFVPLCHDLVAICGERIVGYISFSIVVDEVHLRNIAVHSDWKRHGIASKMLAEMIWLSSKRGADKVTLEVRKSNKGAIELYKKLGFVVEGVRPLYYDDTREDALILWADFGEISWKWQSRKNR